MRGIAPLLVIGTVLGIVVLGGALFEGYRVSSDAASTNDRNRALEDALAAARADNQALSDRLKTELAKNDTFTTQIESIASTVGTLTKLSQTDKELLQKYSRVYFLNENYVPQQLATITPEYTLEPTRTYFIHAKVQPFLERMLADARTNGTPLLVLSSYRSFGDQAQLKLSYKLTYGTGANRFSADQGYSEHQLGTAVDLTTPQLKTTSLAFASTPAGAWLSNHAYEYGFVLSYPPGNTYYQYEPWHWRFVGVNLATRLHQDDIRFYDLPQRDIDTYLVSIFDSPSSVPHP